MWGRKSISMMLMIICSSEVYLEIISCTQTQPQVPCYFVFGDSLSDPGNNNNLSTTAKANYFPYGIDFPGGVATGRFTNGLTHVDVISQMLGFSKYIPPFSETYASPVTVISRGVNYASGGAGILTQTGYTLGEVIYMDQQLKNHQCIASRLGGIIDLSKCLYTVNIGSNDYINNYFAPQGYNTSTIYTPEQYAAVLTQKYYNQMETLYNTSARKIGIFTLGQIGCTPAEIDLYGNGTSCANNITNAVQIFNNQLKSMVDQLNQKYSFDAKFLYVNSTEVQLTNQGFTVDDTSCCVINGTDGLCVKGDRPCLDRTTYIFYDDFHPTEAVNDLLGKSAYTQLLTLTT